MIVGQVERDRRRCHIRDGDEVSASHRNQSVAEFDDRCDQSLGGGELGAGIDDLAVELEN